MTYSATQTETQTISTTETKTVTDAASDPLGGLFGQKVFDRRQLEQGITTVITGAPPTGYGLTGVADVSCPEKQPVVAGTSFTCQLTVDGIPQEVKVEIKDDNGLYEVNPPS